MGGVETLQEPLCHWRLPQDIATVYLRMTQQDNY